MFLRCPFIVSSSPVSNALDTEDVIAAIQDTKLLSVCQHRLKTNLAFLVILLYVGLFFSWIFEISSIGSLRMQIITLFPVSAISFHKKLTDYLTLVVFQEVLNQCIFVILQTLEYCSRHVAFATQSFYSALNVMIFVQNNFFTLNSIILFVIVFKNVRVIPMDTLGLCSVLVYLLLNFFKIRKLFRWKCLRNQLTVSLSKLLDHLNHLQGIHGSKI